MEITLFMPKSSQTQVIIEEKKKRILVQESDPDAWGWW